MSYTVSEIFSIKEGRDLESVGRGRSRSLKIAPYGRVTMYWSSFH